MKPRCAPQRRPERRHALTGWALCAALLIAACGGGSDPQPSDDFVGTTAGVDGSGGTTAATGGGAGDTTGGGGGADVNFSVAFDAAVRATTTQRWQIYMGTQLDALLQPLNALPGLVDETIVVNYARCGQSNAFYNPGTRQITLCDELIDDLLVYWEQLDFAILSAGFVLYHEIGHALDDVRNVPISGNTESAADSIGTMIAALTGRAFGAVFGGDFLSRAPASYGDEHTNGEDRAGDIICWAIGSDSNLLFNSLLAPFTTRFIEANRNCTDEYEQQEASIVQLVPELGGLQTSAVWIPSEITPDDPAPPKSDSPSPGTGEGGAANSVLALLQNEPDATAGRDFWACSASQRSATVGYVFIGERGFYVVDIFDADSDFFNFTVTGVGQDAVQLTYEVEDGEDPANAFVETITELAFSGTTLFAGNSNSDGQLACERTAADAANNKRL